MATYTAIPNTDIETDKPIRAVTGRALRDNPIAIAEGASGAPRVQTAGIDNSAVTTAKLESSERMTTANVLGQTAGASVGAVGTYAFLEGSDISTGSTRSGSNLRYAGAVNKFQEFTSNPTTSDAGANGSPSGTWRCMGLISQDSSGGTQQSASLFLRIS